MDSEGLHADLPNLQAQFFQSNTNRTVEINWTFFKSNLLASVEARIPSKMTKSKFQLPWISALLKRQMRKRDKLLSKAKKTKSYIAWNDYKQQRNKVVKLLKSAHNEYLNRSIGDNLELNPNKFWQYVKHSRSDSQTIPTLRSVDSLRISDKNKANALNNYFQLVFTTDDGNLPPVSSSLPTSIGNIVFDQHGIEKELN